jgi:transcriptional regulator with XRE-family HTH domain
MPPSPPLLSLGFAQVVKRNREVKGFSKAALAEKSGLHQTYIGLLERGLRSPNLETANSIAEALGMPLSRLVEEAEHNNTKRRQEASESTDH